MTAQNLSTEFGNEPRIDFAANFVLALLLQRTLAAAGVFCSANCRPKVQQS
jgi:hypothetical protein